MKDVIVGMSGGVDSSVAAFNLLEQGYRVTGLFMKNWEEDDTEEYCSAAADLADAEAVCKQLGIELKRVNFAHEYWTNVFQLFLNEYRKGRTPNPDVVCNKEIKFKEFLKWALELGADCIATGHYARLQPRNRRFVLRKARDLDKDQSYFLHTLDQEALRYAVFPVGEMQKDSVRERAKSLGLPTHDKKSSTGICFIGERRFRDFLGRFLPAQPGEVKTLQGETIGKHHGAYYYTIGQRHGLGIGGDGDAWYVAGKDVKRNIVYAVQGHNHPALLSHVVLVEKLHWVVDSPPALPTICKAKTRYRQNDQDCTIGMLGPNYSRVVFRHPQWAVTPGQSMVFYQGDICVGGGLIKAAGN